MIFHSTLRQPSDYFPITHSALATQRFGTTMTSRRAPKNSARLVAKIWHVAWHWHTTHCGHSPF